MLRIRLKLHFDAAHYLHLYDGDCGNVHGHRWEIEVCYESDKNIVDIRGIGIDFKDLKKRWEAILPDHRFLNDWITASPSAENLATMLYTLGKQSIDDFSDYRLASVTIWESPNASVEYTEG